MTSLSDPRWTSLSSTWREQLLDKYRDIEVDVDDWFEHVYTNFRERCAELGVRVDEMYFSGFWSQGDGACFEGCVENWLLFFDHAGIKDQPLLLKMAAGEGDWPGWRFSTKHRDRYYHENSVDFEFEMEDDNIIDQATDPLRHAAFQVVIDGIVWEDLYKQFKEAFQDLMRKLYKDLEEEHEHLTSDESVVEFILDCVPPEDLVDPDEENDEEEPESWHGFVPEKTLDSCIEI